MKEKIKFAVVGYGHIGKRHAEMIARNDDAELVAISDILPESEILNTYGVPYYTNIDSLLELHPEAEVVNICTPNGLHADYSLKALNKGKHVVVEKPMALNRHDAERMIFKSLEMSKHVFCVMQNRYSPPSQWLKDIVSESTLGKIFMVQLNCYWNRDDRYYKKGNWHGNGKLDGGTLFTQFSHFIDIMYWLFGDIKNIRGNFHDFNHKDLTDFEDSGIVTFDFINGGMGSINYSTSIWDKNFESSITIIGEKGTVKVAGQYMNEVVYCDIKNYTMPELAPSAPPNDYGLYKGSAQNHHLVIQNVIDKLKEQGTISTNALEGMKVVEIIERIYKERDKLGY